MTYKNVSENAVRRLPRYIRRLDMLLENDVSMVQSRELGESLGLTSAQVRQDLSAFGSFGLQGAGYPVRELRDSLCEVLGMNRGFTGVLIGCGHLGNSMMHQFRFADCGVHLIGAFDLEARADEESDVPILPIERLETFLAEYPADVAILTVAKAEAPAIAARLKQCGIRAIWNFTGAEVSVPFDNVIVENINFADSLLCLGYHLTQKHRQPEIVAENDYKEPIPVRFSPVACAG